MSNDNKIYFNQLELKAVVLGLQKVEEDTDAALKNQRWNWTPESRDTLKEMLTYTRWALHKLAQQFNGGRPFDPIPDLLPGEEDDYLTKPS